MSTAGTINVDNVISKIDIEHAFRQILIVSNGNQTGDKTIITDPEGEILAEHTRPAPGIGYVGNGRPRGRPPENPGSVTEVPTHQPSPMS